MKITQKLFSNKNVIGAMCALTLIGGMTSCTTDNDDVMEESSITKNTSAQTSKSSDFIPDPDKVYMITSSSTPLTLTTDGTGLIIDTPKNMITVQELWRFSPGATAGSYYIDCLGGKSSPRLSTENGFMAPTSESEASDGLAASWSITSAGSGDYFFTSLGENIPMNRLTSFGWGFSSITYGARLTTDDQAGDLQKFTITEVAFPFAGNRAPITDSVNRSIRSFTSKTIDVLANDYDPDGDELTLVGFSATDSRVSVQQVGNSLKVTLNTFDRGLIDITYTVSDGKGATSTGLLQVGKFVNNF